MFKLKYFVWFNDKGVMSKSLKVRTTASVTHAILRNLLPDIIMT